MPDDLATYDAERFAAERLVDERGGSQAYYRALRRAGVSDAIIAHRLRAAACVVDLRAELAARQAEMAD